MENVLFSLLFSLLLRLLIIGTPLEYVSKLHANHDLNIKNILPHKEGKIETNKFMAISLNIILSQ